MYDQLKLDNQLCFRLYAASRLVTQAYRPLLEPLGLTYPQYYMLRPLHLFMQDYGELLAPMEASFPSAQDLKRGEDSALRWAVRSKDGQGFIFVNNYERFFQLSAKKGIVLEACGVKFPKLTIPSGCMAVFPVNVEGIRFATAQLVACRDGKIYMMQVKGVPTTIALANGKTLKNVKPRGLSKPVYENIYLLTQQEAERLFLCEEDSQLSWANCQFNKVKEAGPLRKIIKGKAKVAEAPSEADWNNAAIYHISLTSHPSPLTSMLSISYRGDCARLYADGKLVADNFYYGRPFLYGLWRLPKECKELELRILPLQPDAPIYLPREADKTAGEELINISVSCEK